MALRTRCIDVNERAGKVDSERPKQRMGMKVHSAAAKKASDIQAKNLRWVYLPREMRRCHAGDEM